ncbi:MAG: sulfatase [Acidobacteria bacterium]|nr:sulfatase [Acidobacteriota bacterium]
MGMTRRAFLTAAAASAQTGRPKPNVIVILADDLGYGDVSCYGGQTPTPNLDRMAAEGMRLTDFYVPMPYCAPTRSALLTGRYPFRTTITRNPTPDAGINDYGLPAGEVTIAEMLRPAGYKSCCIGKWHLGHIPKFLPRTQGFDEYHGILYSNDMRPVQLVHNETVTEYPVYQGKLTGFYTRRAIAFLQQNKTRPFFLYLPHAMPHKPLAASEDFYTPETPGDLYADVLRELDHSIGQLLEAVKSAGIEQNTLIFFTSDNGPWYGGSTGGLRGMKASNFEGGIRVPGLVRWPGRIPANQTSGAMAGVIDILPTVAAACGVRPPETKIDGRNLLPLLTGQAKDSPHEALFSMNGDELVSVRQGRWKLHVKRPAPGNRPGDPLTWVDPRGPDGVTILAPFEQAKLSQHPGVTTGPEAKPMMLFDLDADRAEQNDAAGQNPEIVARLRGIYDRMNSEVRPTLSPKAQPLRRVKGGALRYDQ